jgi:protein-tyrosine phosphatase
MESPLHTVLFICTGNYYRSRFAEAVFNYYADLMGLDWHAFSRGLAPDLVYGELSPRTRDALLARGISLGYTAATKALLTLNDLEAADRVIALKESEHRLLMRRQFPEWIDRIEYWQFSDLDYWGPMDTLSRIELRVTDLLDELVQLAAQRATSTT